jgi:hypothetical protein
MAGLLRDMRSEIAQQSPSHARIFVSRGYFAHRIPATGLKYKARPNV